MGRAVLFLTVRVVAAVAAYLFLVLALGALGLLGSHYRDVALLGIAVVVAVMWQTPSEYQRL